MIPKETVSNVHYGAYPTWLGATKAGQLGSTHQKVGDGNVHSGAPPPWLEATGGDEQRPVLNKSRKSKLNPKRVGAAWAEKRKREMEMEKRGEIVKSDFDPNWLPNFGRVWQSGSRKESRKEFEMEKHKNPDVDCRLEMPVAVQPYISKRMVS